MNDFELEMARPDPRVAEELAAATGSRLMGRLLASRGVSNATEHAKAGARLLHWTELKGAELAARELANAIENGEEMTIVADYDCDGATSCAVMTRAIKAMGGKIGYYVPNRFHDGYGLTRSIVEKVVASRPETKVLVTVDNGILSFDGVDAANERGIRVVITDHHLAGDRLPAAAAIVNPNQPGCTFPSKNLAGVGVAFYVAAALREELARRGSLRSAFKVSELFDLVAVGTVADVVKLDSNNRRIVKTGLTRMRAGLACEGVKALFEVSGDPLSRATTQSIAFRVGPKLNAAGRLEDMTKGVRLLTTDDREEALALAEELNALNMKRKEIEKEMQSQAAEALENFDESESMSICAFAEDFHEGVIGLVAGRIKESRHRPTIAFAKAEGGFLKGSGRSIPGFHLKDALERVGREAPGLLVKFGGHAMAAGLTIKSGDFDLFRKVFEDVCAKTMPPEALRKTVLVDEAPPVHEMTVATAEMIEAEAWGQGFPEPLFVAQATVVEERQIGKEKNHLKMKVEIDGERFDAIRFFDGTLVGSERAEIVFSLTTNVFNGQIDVQLNLKRATPM